MDLNRVALFVRIVENGGVTAAATALKVPKSSVSRGLTGLEEDLGAQLIMRGTRQFRLSDAGRAFFEAASKGLAAVEEARHGVRDERAVPRGLLRIAAPPDLGAWLVTPVVADFVRKYPEVEVEISVWTGQVDPVRDGFDVVICVGKLADSSLILRSLGAGDAGVFASADYLRRRGTPTKPMDLASHDCVLLRPSGKKGRWALTGPAGVTNVAVHGPIRVDDIFTATAAVVADAGLAVLPLDLPRSQPAARSLVRVLPEHVVVGEPVQLVYPGSRHVPHRVTLFCDALALAASTQCPSKARISAPPSGKSAKGPRWADHRTVP